MIQGVIMSIQLDHSSSTSSPILNSESAELIAAMETLAGHGFKAGTQSFQIFADLPEPRRQSILAKLRQDIAFYEGASQAGVRKCKSVDLLRHFLSKANWSVSEDVLSRLSDQDVIEVYSPTFTQLFRNMRFLEICSYPILDIYMYEWPELYARPQAITEALIQEFFRMLSAPPGVDLFEAQVPDHFLEEVFSEERRIFEIQQKLNSPVRSRETGEVVAVLGVLQASVISKKGQPRSILPLGRPVSVGNSLSH
jgi:hypothetical protein